MMSPGLAARSSRRLSGRGVLIGLSQSAALQQHECPPPRIELPGIESHPCRLGICVVVVVPALTVGQESPSFEIRGLHRGILDQPPSRAQVVSEVVRPVNMLSGMPVGAGSTPGTQARSCSAIKEAEPSLSAG